LTTRNKLIYTEIFETTFVFLDIYNESNDDFKKFVDSLSDTELAEFIEENLHCWRKEFESGIMSNWDAVAKTVASDTTLSKVS
jgi:hypothetical protein